MRVALPCMSSANSDAGSGGIMAVRDSSGLKRFRHSYGEMEMWERRRWSRRCGHERALGQRGLAAADSAASLAESWSKSCRGDRAKGHYSRSQRSGRQDLLTKHRSHGQAVRRGGLSVHSRNLVS